MLVSFSSNSLQISRTFLSWAYIATEDTIGWLMLWHIRHWWGWGSLHEHEIAFRKVNSRGHAVDLILATTYMLGVWISTYLSSAKPLL